MTRRVKRDAFLQIWEQARRIDPSLRVSQRDLPVLRRRQLRAVPFSRELLFSRMATGEPILFSNLPVAVRGERELGAEQAVLHALRNGFPSDYKFQVRCGPSDSRKSVILDELLRRWNGNRAQVSVTDLHIRGTKVTKHIDCAHLSDFNLLAEARGEVGEQEMLTMVVSSKGTFTDSHSDDPDGSNHCFVGKKLWLVWDTFSGLAQNLDDCERCEEIDERAAFSIPRFLAVPRSRWFVVEEGQTLFLPGHLTHKVVTLESYLGIGSFFVMLPSYMRTLSRWTRHTPLWALNEPHDRRLKLVDRITRRVIDKAHLLATASAAERRRWGLTHLQSTVSDWLRSSSAEERRAVLSNDVSARFLKSVLDIGSTGPYGASRVRPRRQQGIGRSGRGGSEARPG